MSYVTWEYYSSLFDKVSKNEFDKLAAQAEKRIDYLTHGRAGQFMSSYSANHATDFQKHVYESVMFTTCELINKLYLQQSSSVGSGLSSVSNDGYSESYTVTTESERQTELDTVVRQGLSGTGLAGVL